MGDPLDWSGHVMRALAAIKHYWDQNKDYEHWDELVPEFEGPARIQALILAALMIADRGGLSALDLEAWGDELIAASRRKR